MLKSRKDFEGNIDFISNTFASEGYPISGMISELHPTELQRLVEAIHCFFEGCHHSAVAMAASAIEFRLLDFMEKVSPSTREALQEEPLGSLIRKCLEDPVYSKKLPDRHRPLLELCNRYRIFSVHPKTEILGQNEATSVINLAFSFILDPRMRKASFESPAKGS